jgi:hypothetical protein
MNNSTNTEASCLSDELAAGLPDFTNDRGKLNVRKLAVELKVTWQAVYKWLDANELPARQVKPILEIAGCQIKKKKLLEFTVIS